MSVIVMNKTLLVILIVRDLNNVKDIFKYRLKQCQGHF